MTPMIDVIFLLIIFFLCVSQFQKAESNEKVQLPEAVSTKEPTEERASRFIVHVLQSGTIIVGGEATPAAQIGPLIARKRDEVAPEPVEVWIRADRNTPYRAVEPILLACAQTNVWKVSFKVVSPSPTSAP
jgi:biopolymer transport protein ExbD